MLRLPFPALLALIVFLPLLLQTSAPADARQQDLTQDPSQDPLQDFSQATTASAGLVQIRLSGAVSAPATDGSGGEFGHLVEVEIDAVGNGGRSGVVLHLHLAAGTTGKELLQMVSAQLATASIRSSLAVTESAGSLWVEGAMRVHLRLGGGLIGEVSCAEGPPQSVRIRPASAMTSPMAVQVSASTAIVMNGRPPIRGRATFKASLEQAEHAAEAATALWEAAKGKWISDRPGADAWRPIKMSDGAAITGVSIRLTGEGDWALEVEL